MMQSRHSTPPVPHAVELVPAAHVFPTQQPLAQFCGVQGTGAAVSTSASSPGMVLASTPASSSTAAAS